MKVAIEPKAYSSETLSSWLIRMAFANGTDPKSFALSVFKQDSIWYKDLDRYLPKNLKLQLSKLVSLSKDEITSLTLEPLISDLALYPKDNPYKKWHYILPIGLKGFIKTNGAYFCPHCFLNKTTTYLKQEWRLSWNVTCPLHKTLLLLRCQKCNTIFSPHKLSYLQPSIYLCSSCGFDLRESITKKGNDEVLLLQSKLNQIAFKNQSVCFKLKTQDKKDFFATLHIFLAFFAKTSKYNYHLSLMKFLNLPPHTLSKQHNATFNRLNVEDREYLLLACSKILQYSVHEIIELFHEFNISKQRFLFTYKNLSPTITYISKQLSNSSMKGKKKQNNQIVGSSRKVSPKPLLEVNKLFQDIEQFL